MSRSNVPQSGRKRHQTQLSRQLLMQYLLALIVWAAAVVLFVFFAWEICQNIIWQETNLLYNLLNWVREYILFWIGLLILSGWVGISYYYLSKPLRYLDDLVSAAELLAEPKDEPLVLPPAMKNLEDELNLIRQQALRNAEIAREAEQRKNDLIVYLAHDLKTPLTSVIGYLSLLRDEPQISPELRARYTGIALEKAERLEDLINEFFDITRFNLSKMTLETSRVDLTRMLEQVASEFEPVFAEKDLHCRLALPPKLECDCDPDKLARVFDNLLRNAQSYGTPGTDVVIEADDGEDAVCLRFSNEGRTIPPEKLARIFEQFYRLDSSRASRTGGSGLGLAIAKQIVELHGGTIRAESADLRVCFTVTLPRGQHVRKS